MDSDYMLHTFLCWCYPHVIFSCYLEQSLWTSFNIWLGNQAALHYDNIFQNNRYTAIV
jgi:hypothetical protein